MGACLLVAGAASAILPASAGVAIRVTLDHRSARSNAVVDAHTDYAGAARLPLYLLAASALSGNQSLMQVNGALVFRPARAPSFGAGMVARAMLDGTRSGRVTVVYIGTLVAGGGHTGNLAFTVPGLPPATYRILAWCRTCATGGSLIPGPTLVIDAGPRASASWLPIATVVGVGFLVACGLAAWLARRHAWPHRRVPESHWRPPHT
jgi:hypothetical protein